MASRWEGVRLPRASGKSPDFPGSSPSELINKKLPIPLPILYYFELIKVTVADGPVSVLPPPLRIAQKLPIRNCWKLRIGELPDTVTDFLLFDELIRLAIPIAQYRPQIRPPARNGKKWPKKWIFGPTGKREKIAEKWENGHFGPIF